MIDDDEVTGRLCDYLQARFASPVLGYVRPPQRILGGLESDIFRLELSNAPAALSGPLILRRLRSSQSPYQARFEAAVQNAVSDLGYPSARVVLVEGDVAVLGAAFLLMQELPGQALARGFEAVVANSGTGKIAGLLLDAPRVLSEIAATWAGAHLQLHAIPVEPVRQSIAAAGATLRTFESRLDSIEHDIARYGANRLGPVVAWLKARRPDPQADVLCHGDFHPLNILSHKGRITGVIDWGNAALGEPAFDLGSTIANILTAPIRGPKLLRPAVGGLLRYALGLYLRAYRQGRSVDRAAVHYYQVYRCAEQLVVAAREGTAASVNHSPEAQQNRIDMIRKLTGITILR